MTRFPDYTPWRFVVTDLDSVTLTFLDHLATNRRVFFGLNVPAVASGQVPSDNPEVNILSGGDPFVQEGIRLLYGFRREGDPTDSSGIPRWVVRFAGLILQLEDTAASDTAQTPYTAYDPWQYLLSRPVCGLTGTLPGTGGLSFTATQAGTVIATLLRNTISNHGETFIDAGASWGGTGFWSGQIDTTPQIDINFEQGLSVGEAWQQVCDLNVADIILTPIYDPINRPGYLCELNVYELAGVQQDAAIFAWDMPSRSLTGISRLRDGTTRANKVQFFIEQGGAAVTLQTNASSVTRYGQYWAQQFFPGQSVVAAVVSLAQLQLALRANGKVTVTIDPAAERSPDPFTEYFLGDTVPIYASTNLREALTGYQRIYGIPIDIDDNGVENIRQLLTSPEA
jgi:hypothetical protein